MSGEALAPTLAFLREALGLGDAPIDAAALLGSGLDGCAGAVSLLAEVPYAEIPGMAAPSVAGHKGALALGVASGLRVLVFRGRRHYYETGSMAEAALPARLAAALGARLLTLFSAVGGVDETLAVGDWVYVSDHLNLMGLNPLLGVSTPGGPPFLDLAALYRVDLCRDALARLPGVFARPPRPAVLAAFCGPTYETPAEVRMARALGAGVVGMSTVPEAVWARHLGLAVAAWARVANPAAGLGESPIRHEDILHQASSSSGEAARLLAATLEAFAAFPPEDSRSLS